MKIKHIFSKEIFVVIRKEWLKQPNIWVIQSVRTGKKKTIHWGKDKMNYIYLNIKH